jgi:protease I
MARVLVLTGDAAEELDSMYPIFRLREGGHEAVVAAPTTRPVHLVVHDFEPGWAAYTEKPGHLLPVDLAFADVDPGDFDALVIPGGRAPEYLRTDPEVARIVPHFFERGLPVGTICHGAQVPAALVSCRGWPDLPEWSRAFLRVLEKASPRPATTPASPQGTPVGRTS